MTATTRVPHAHHYHGSTQHMHTDNSNATHSLDERQPRLPCRRQHPAIIIIINLPAGGSTQPVSNNLRRIVWSLVLTLPARQQKQITQVGVCSRAVTCSRSATCPCTARHHLPLTAPHVNIAMRLQHHSLLLCGCLLPSQDSSGCCCTCCISLTAALPSVHFARPQAREGRGGTCCGCR